jgi:hypothetical protein
LIGDTILGESSFEFNGTAKLPATQQALQRSDPDTSAPVSKLGERRCRKRDLDVWRHSLVNESLEPTQRRSLVPRRIDVGQEFAERERIGR